jgi:aquaporin Z
MKLTTRAIAEAIGTFWLVFGGCGAAVLACGVPTTGIGYVGVSLAFGLTVLTMAYAIGHISGCHLNPAVTLGQVAGGRFPAKEAPAYIIAQVIGGIVAAAVLYCIAQPDLTNAGIGAFATNGWSDTLTNGVNAFGGKTTGMCGAFLIETVLTAIFLFVIMGATDGRAPAGFAPIAIGLCLTLIHLISIPVTNTSVNPARSTAMAVFVGGAAIKQLWLFWVAPILGGVIGGIGYKCLAECKCCKSDKK